MGHYLPSTIAPWKMDLEKIVVRQLVDIEFVTVVQYYVKYHISDNCRDQLHNHVSFVLFHVAVETIEPTHFER